ncbi:MAG: hypothetical protein BWK79_15550 [Beggiatoa sp. IS2]|nr:MAG: hypothetical protein BWK79_15550 [Beggiatoa sp. IS2]
MMKDSCDLFLQNRVFKSVRQTSCLTKKVAGFLLCLISSLPLVATAAETLPELSEAKAISVTTGFVSNATQFSGSVSSPGGIPATALVASASQPVEVKVSMSIDSADVGKTVDILFVVGTEPSPAPYSGNEDTRYTAFTTTAFTSVDLYAAPQIWMAQLSEPYIQDVVLANQFSLKLGQWSFDTEGMNYLFVGYRSDDGMIVYTAKPLMVEITGTGETPTTPTGNEPAEFAGMVAAHNVWRQKVSVPDLTWSDEAAKVAQGWADSLKEQGCDMKHNPNRGPYGENIYWSSGFTPTSKDVVDAWGNEISDYNYATNSCASGKMCGHYTQVVWRDTQQVGCGKASCGNQQIWVCNYSPPGNYIGEKPY